MKVRIRNLVILNTAAFLIMVIVIAAIIYYDYEYDVKKIKFYFRVGDYSGFNLTKDSLNFGTFLNDGGLVSSRNIIIKPDADVFVKIKVKNFDFVTPENNDFIVKKDQSRELAINLNLPENMSYGNYEGELIVVSKRI